MKTKILIFLLVLSNHIGFSQQTYIPDDNFEKGLIELGYDSGPLNDYVPTANINTITGLALNYKNIKDFTGIEDFTELSNFRCEGNQFTSINLSNNLKLSLFSCSDNALTELDLSKNQALISVICDRNKLTSLDLSHLSNLNELNCENNSISTLNLPQNNSLKTLFTTNNFLKKIDISFYTNLEFFSCGNNQLTEIDTKNNNLLINLFLANNQISNLDITQNTQLTNLDCSTNLLTTLDISNNNKLTYLGCSDNQLTDLNVSNLTFLRHLYSQNNKITKLDLSNSSALIFINCENNQLEFLDLRNGNNKLINGFFAKQNPNLSCIIVDDPAFSQSNWNDIDSASIFYKSISACSKTDCTPPPIDALEDVEFCESFTLENLVNGQYFTESSGGGFEVNPGFTITYSQTLFIYAADPDDPSCFNESPFNVTINIPPIIYIPNKLEVCGSYELPEVEHGIFYSEPNAQGTKYNVGDLITSSQTLYIYTTHPNDSQCNRESSLVLTVHPIPDFSINDSNIKINQNATTIKMNDASENYQYAIDNSPYQDSPNFSNLDVGDHILFVKDEHNCTEKSFEFSIKDAYLIPRFFTPNNDGVNDTWIVEDNRNSVTKIYIFNRFGKVVAELVPNTEGWNGNYNGIPLPSSTYWYSVRLKSGDEFRGSVLLKR